MIGLIASLPNLFSSATLEDLPDWFPKRQINLGLDLQGGSHLLLEVGVAAVIQERLETLESDIRLGLRRARIGYRALDIRNDALSLNLTDPTQLDAALDEITELNPRMTTTIGTIGDREFDVDSNNNGRISIGLSEEGRDALVLSTLAQSLEVVRRRIDEIGTREPTIQRQGVDRILVQVPGEQNPENVKNLLGQTAKLSFHMVDLEASIQDALNGRVPAGSMLVESQDDQGPAHYVVRKRVDVSGENLVDAQPQFQDNQPVVSFRFDSVGARRFGQITQENVGDLFAIVLDEKVISAPRIREPILGGSGVISGSFTVQAANELAILLRAGALPAPLTIIEERTVGPDLGADSVRAGEIASIIALVVVAIFMGVYYRVFGLVANVALLTNIVLIMGVLSLIQATLTLPGIAGIVLTIGMAVDANVLIFERIREETRAGRTPISAVETGYGQAMRAIIDANVTTLIAALCLYQFGSGPIKGFAVTLAIGIATSMFTAIVLSKLVITLWYRRTRPKALPV
ncbi:MAG: protein translocase subunit SecD [Pseudomonadota bacterium]